ncbi:MAG TPA: type II secretion system protein [Thermoanaerobaculia bacterium]|nr:type II secretion system protein [Thermoanaerobaculia bacterium]
MSQTTPTVSPAFAPDRAPERAQRGFTLLELIVVIAIIGILATIAMPAMKDMPRRASESVLKTNLRTMRDVIDQHYGDKGFYPASLEALVEARYLRKIPVDITKSTETWVLVYEEEDPDNPPAETEQPEGGEPGVVDVHSGSPLNALDGTPYAEW